ncbi:MAG TPA: iron dependent repressor, metal binding and dimerization domain protein [Alphaproteobacteria bacterium]|nr:iron dependent repressor, metal binding and dimerization domain protein [Alphaproteobacteria bacterium]
MEREKLVSISDGRIVLSDKGLEMASERVRRHRLAEKLFMEVLDQGPVRGQENACRFEHTLTAEMADSICSFLRHPSKCPHGKSIPPGPCCKGGNPAP